MSEITRERVYRKQIRLPPKTVQLFDKFREVFDQDNKLPFPSCKKILYMIKANKLFEEKYIDTSIGGRKQKIIVNSIIMGVYESDKETIIRGFKMAYLYNEKVSALDGELMSLLNRPVSEKINQLTYTDYIFRNPDKRLIVTPSDISNKPTSQTRTPIIPITSNIS